MAIVSGLILNQRRLQAEKERKFWILGGVIIGIVAIAGIFALYWAITL